MTRRLQKLFAVSAFTVALVGCLAVQSAWAQSGTSYASKVMSYNPYGFWLLDEAGDPTTGTLVAADASINGLNGLYGTSVLNGFSSIEGPRPPGYPGFGAANAAIQGFSGDSASYVHLPKGNWEPTNTVTFAMWVYPSGPVGAWTGLLCSRNGGAGTRPGGVDFNDKGMLGYIWNNDTTWSFNSGLVVPVDQWSFVAVTIEPTKATLYLNYVDATTGATNYLSAVNQIAHSSDNLGKTNDWRLATDFYGSRNFNGIIDAPAIFRRTLSSSEISALFAAGLGMNAVAPAISQTPVSKIIYSGRAVRFTVGASGTPAPTFQWQVKVVGSSQFTNLVDSATVLGAQSTVLTLSNVGTEQAGEYRAVASNLGGSAASTPATLTVLAIPALGSYPDAVYTNGPIAYWRLGENYSRTNAVDFMGDLMGDYFTAALWGADAPGGAIVGPRSPQFPGFEANNTAVQTSGDGGNPSWVNVPTVELTTNAATIIAWINPAVEPQADWTGILMIDANYQEPGLCITTGGQLGYRWNLDATGGFQSGLVPPANQWSMVALVVEAQRATIYMGSGGSLTNAVNLVSHIREPAWGLGASIGCDRASLSRTFQGVIDEVAMFDKALSFDQINTLYGLAKGSIQPVAPAFVRQPASTIRYAGASTALNSLVTGSSPLRYQWFKGGVPLADGGSVTGATTDTLTLSHVAVADAGNYTLVVTNAGGSVASGTATVSVVVPTTAYEAAVLAASPAAYWRLNETNDPSSDTVLARDLVGGFDGTYGNAGQSGYYEVAGPRAADGFGIFEAGNFAMRSANGIAQSWVTAPQPALNANHATFTMWVYPEGDQADWVGLLMNRSGAGEGVGLGGDLGGGVTSHNMLGYTWNNNSTWNYVSGLTLPQFQWSFVAVTIEPTRAILYLANTNGMQTATNAIAQDVGAWGGSASIGCDGSTSGRAFSGILDEVAIFNYTLTPKQVQDLYAGIANPRPAPKVSIAAAPTGKITIAWEGSGTLQSAPALQGAATVWTDLGTTSPTVVTPSGDAEFYRVRLP